MVAIVLHLLNLLVTDGDLLVLICKMLHLRGRGTVRITKVKGHADEGMFRDGGVRELDRLGNSAMQLMRRLIWVVGGSISRLLMLGTTLLGSAGGGTRLF